MKIPLSVVAAIAKREGFKGDPLDGAAVKAFLLALAEPITELEYENEKVAVKDLDFAPAAKARTVKIDPEKPKAEDPPADLDEKIKAVAEQMLTKAGFKRDGDKFVPINPDGLGKRIKSGAEREYEDKIKRKQAVFEDYDQARGFAELVRIKALGSVGRWQDAQKATTDHNEWMSQKGYTILTEGSGGALVPEGYDNQIIRLVKDYGVARRICRVVDMNTDTWNRPKVTTIGLTVYYPADGGTATESTETWGRVILKAKQGVVMVKMSRAILDDAMINVIEDTSREAARAIAKVEDATLFNGDGSGNGAGGLYIPTCQGLTSLVADTSTNSRTQKSAGTTPGAATLTEVTAFMGLCPQFARNNNTAFHCTPEMVNIIITRLGQSAGGALFREFQDFGDVPYMLGRPIITNNVMPNANTTTANRCNMIFGDMTLAADFGNRKGVEIDISDQRFWDSVNLALRAVVRHDINVHDVGGTATQSPVVFLTQT